MPARAISHRSSIYGSTLPPQPWPSWPIPCPATRPGCLPATPPPPIVAVPRVASPCPIIKAWHARPRHTRDRLTAGERSAAEHTLGSPPRRPSTPPTLASLSRRPPGKRTTATLAPHPSSPPRRPSDSSPRPRRPRPVAPPPGIDLSRRRLTPPLPRPRGAVRAASWVRTSKVASQATPLSLHPRPSSPAADVARRTAQGQCAVDAQSIYGPDKVLG